VTGVSSNGGRSYTYKNFFEWPATVVSLIRTAMDMSTGFPRYLMLYFYPQFLSCLTISYTKWRCPVVVYNRVKAAFAITVNVISLLLIDHYTTMLIIHNACFETQIFAVDFLFSIWLLILKWEILTPFHDRIYWEPPVL